MNMNIHVQLCLNKSKVRGMESLRVIGVLFQSTRQVPSRKICPRLLKVRVIGVRFDKKHMCVRIYSHTPSSQLPLTLSPTY